MVVQFRPDGPPETGTFNVKRGDGRAAASPEADKALRVAGAPVRVSGVHKNYGTVAAVKSATFTVEEGEIIALLGPSGCGKTTLLRCIAGLEEINGGTIEIDNAAVSSETLSVPPEQRKVGFVFQSYALWPHLTVTQNVAYGLKVAKRKPAEIRSLVDGILDLVGLTEYAARLPGELSGGQQQRVALARSLVVRPRVLLLDEPLSNLDASLRDRMRQEIRQLLKQVGITAVFVTHDQREAFAISDRVVLMNAGIAVQIDTPEAMYARPASVFAATFLGAANVVPVTAFKENPKGFDSGRTADGGLLNGTKSIPDGAFPEHAMFRPENVRIVQAAPSDAINLWDGEVVQRTFEGAYTELVVQSNSSLLRVVGQHHAVEVGDHVLLQVAPTDLLFLSQ